MLIAADITDGLDGEMRGYRRKDCSGQARMWGLPADGTMYPQARTAFGRW